MDNLAVVLEVTPKMAREWLTHNTANRSVKPRVVAAYARDMAGGQWEYNGESVKFDITGKLLDGQHRLAAIVEAGATVKMLIVRGLRGETQETMDTGSRRSFADALKIRGEVSVNELAALCRRVRLSELYGMKAGVVNRPGDARKGQPTTSELSNVLERCPELRNYPERSRRVSRVVSSKGAAMGFLMWTFDQIDAEDSMHFFNALESGEMLAPGDPILVLRQSLQNNKFTSRYEDAVKTGAYIIKAWNKFRSGEPLFTLGFRAGGASPEPFPTPK